MSLEEIGARLHAGSNCGTCVPELRAFLGQVTKVGA